MNDPIDALTFEEGYSELDAIVRRLESGELPLEESVALYERGRQLAAHCQHLLDVADLRITQLGNHES